MSNTFFQFKQFLVNQDRSGMKVTTDSCLFGAWAADILEADNSKKSILDIGAGTGLLSLMLTQKTDSTIDAVELDEMAYEQCRDNFENSPWKDRLRVFHSDILNFQTPTPYDVIIGNPPFYENELKGPDARKNTAHHEGITFRELIGFIKQNLKKDGRFYLLLPYKRNDEIREQILKQGLSLTKLVFVQQSPDHDYFRIMLEGTNGLIDENATRIDEIMIRKNKEDYTRQFTALLSDYYLHL